MKKVTHARCFFTVAVVVAIGTVPFARAADDPDPEVDSIVIEPAVHKPITMQQRIDWWARSTFGPANLLGGAITSAVRTGIDHPPEYGTHWEGFADRYGIREAGVATSNAMEASLGAIWGEDPRYPREGETAGFGARLGHAVKWTFLAENRNGDAMPAYARYLAVSGTAFLSNSWRVPSEDGVHQAAERIGTSFLSKVGGNAFKEFWPDLKEKFVHHQPE